MPQGPRSEFNVPLATVRGRQAFLSRIDVAECPNRPGTVDAVLWICAWLNEEREAEEAIVALCNQRGRLHL